MLLGMMGIVVFNLVDTYFVGKLGVHQLAAMSFSFPVVMVLNSISLGIGIGTSSLISRHIIKTERRRVQQMGGRALLLGFTVVMLFVIAGQLTIRPLFAAMGAGPVVLGYVEEYMRIWYLGVPFVLFPMIGNNIIRATGDTFTPGMIMVTSGVLNAVLDPILIFGYGPVPYMGIQGAALATVLARSVSFTIVMVVLTRREKLITFALGRIGEIGQTWRNILHIAGPATLTLLITPLSIGVITRILASFGKEAVAAFGVASRVEMFAIMLINALGSVLVIFAGQNISRHKYQRILDALTISTKFSLFWGAVVFLLLLAAGEVVASLFSTDRTVIDITKMYFLIVSASYGFQGLVLLSTSTFNGLNRPYPSAGFSILRMVVLYLPLAWIGARLFDLPGVFWAAFIANVVSGLFSMLYLFRLVRNMRRAHDTGSGRDPEAFPSS